MVAFLVNTALTCSSLATLRASYMRLPSACVSPRDYHSSITHTHLPSPILFVISLLLGTQKSRFHTARVGACAPCNMNIYVYIQGATHTHTPQFPFLCVESALQKHRRPFASGYCITIAKAFYTIDRLFGSLHCMSVHGYVYY